MEEVALGGMEDDLLTLYGQKRGLLCQVYCCEADELWSFVGSKANKQWVWLVMCVATRQIVALHVGGRGEQDAQQLWEQVPQILRQQAGFFTDFWRAYSVIDPDRHYPAGKQKGLTNHIERFNNTLRQRCSRLVRKALSFSKKMENHVGAIKYFICHYNRSLALLV